MSTGRPFDRPEFQEICRACVPGPVVLRVLSEALPTGGNFDALAKHITKLDVQEAGGLEIAGVFERTRINSVQADFCSQCFDLVTCVVVVGCNECLKRLPVHGQSVTVVLSKDRVECLDDAGAGQQSSDLFCGRGFMADLKPE